MILSPYTTYKLQPLDVGLFQSLSTAYSQELERLMSESDRLVSMSKRFFYRLFKNAWEKAFTLENIQHAFAKPGIWSVDCTQVVTKMLKPAVDHITPATQIQSPKNAKDIRRLRTEYNKRDSKQKEEQIDHLFEIMLKGFSKISVLEHENKGLRSAIIMEQKKRKKGKKLNLAGEESDGIDIWSPAKVAKAVAYQAEKEVQAQVEEDAKEARRIVRETKKAENDKKKEEKEACQAAKQLQSELSKAALLPPITPKRASTTSKSKTKAPKTPVLRAPKVSMPVRSPQKQQSKNHKGSVVVPEVVGVEARPMQVNRAGRAIKLPQRFQQ